MLTGDPAFAFDPVVYQYITTIPRHQLPLLLQQQFDYLHPDDPIPQLEQVEKDVVPEEELGTPDSQQSPVPHHSDSDSEVFHTPTEFTYPESADGDLTVPPPAPRRITAAARCRREEADALRPAGYALRSHGPSPPNLWAPAPGTLPSGAGRAFSAASSAARRMLDNVLGVPPPGSIPPASRRQPKPPETVVKMKRGAPR